MFYKAGTVLSAAIFLLLFSAAMAQTTCPVDLFSRFQLNICRSPPSPSPPTGAVGAGPNPTQPLVLATTLAPSTTPDPPERCHPKPNCPSTIERFYRPDGSCNNLLDGRKGMAGQPHKRLIPADFADGKGTPRADKFGSLLPSARMISVEMKEDSTPASSDVAHFSVIWGQFITHDITDTPVIDRGGRGVNCQCGSTDPGCFNIRVPPNDRFNVQEGRTCLSQVRSQPIEDADCDASIRQTKNDITPYLDAGTVYGNSQAKLDALLDPVSRIGKLKTGRLFPHGHSPLNAPSLPLTTQVNHEFRDVACPAGVHKPAAAPCFVGGDIRANEQPSLASMHTLLLRLHNRLVQGLSLINTHWNSNRLVNTARLIVSAVVQRATYGQFLPAMFGDTHMQAFGLKLTQQGYWYGYDSSYDATTSNSFIVAVLRVGHTLVNSELSRPSPTYNQQGTTLKLKDSFFDTTPLLTTIEGGANSILRGLTSDPAQKMDSTFIEDLRDFLFAPTGFLGSDLMALNLQRGRDHGVPGYNHFRAFCGLGRVRQFLDFIEIPIKRRLKLQRLYRHVDDVDLYIGGISENSVPGGVFGPTFACLAGYQFRDLKRGDRLWHENGGPFSTFTPAQLQAIRDYSMSKVLCDTLDDMKSVQPNPFLQHTVAGNFRRSCKSYASLNLNPWRDGFCNPAFPASNSYEWTTWFPVERNMKSDAILANLLAKRPDDVCNDVVGSEERNIRGNKQIRFQCPSGSIQATDYPNADINRGFWGAAEDRSTPTSPSYDDDETRIFVHPSCVEPVAIQVISVDGTPARQTGEVFEKFSKRDGFVCRGKDQADGRCQDYQVRYLCKPVGSSTPVPTPPPTPTPTPTRTQPPVSRFIWTRWSNEDRPNTGGGDYESLFAISGRRGFCRNPVDIQGRTVSRRTPAQSTGQVISFSVLRGLECLNSAQRISRCRDYEVRYLCNVNDIN